MNSPVVQSKVSASKILSASCAVCSLLLFGPDVVEAGGLKSINPGKAFNRAVGDRVKKEFVDPVEKAVQPLAKVLEPMIKEVITSALQVVTNPAKAVDTFMDRTTGLDIGKAIEHASHGKLHVEDLGDVATGRIDFGKVVAQATAGSLNLNKFVDRLSVGAVDLKAVTELSTGKVDPGKLAEEVAKATGGKIDPETFIAAVSAGTIDLETAREIATGELTPDHLASKTAQVATNQPAVKKTLEELETVGTVADLARRKVKLDEALPAIAESVARRTGFDEAVVHVNETIGKAKEAADTIVQFDPLEAGRSAAQRAAAAAARKAGVREGIDRVTDVEHAMESAANYAKSQADALEAALQSGVDSGTIIRQAAERTIDEAREEVAAAGDVRVIQNRIDKVRGDVLMIDGAERVRNLVKVVPGQIEKARAVLTEAATGVEFAADDLIECPFAD
jgi:hypothetical protein